jgi:hypothetical protein
VGLAVARAQGGSIMMTSNCSAFAKLCQSYVETLAWMGMQCGGTCVVHDDANEMQPGDRGSHQVQVHH